MLIQKSDGGIQVTMMPPSDQKYKMRNRIRNSTDPDRWNSQYWIAKKEIV